MKIIQLFFLTSLLISTPLLADQNQVRLKNRKPASERSIQNAIAHWKSLLKCAENITSRDSYINCTSVHVLRKNNEANFMKIISSVVQTYPDAKHFRECSDKDLELFPMYNEQTFDFLICFDFNLNGLKKTVISFIDTIDGNTQIKNLEY